MMHSPSPTVPSNLDDYTEEMLEKAQAAFAIVRQQLDASFERAKRRYDKRVKSVQFKVGEFVWFYSPRPPKKDCLESGWRIQLDHTESSGS
jgi:hypothetical protein